MKKALVLTIGLVLVLGVSALASTGVGVFAFDDLGTAQIMITSLPDSNNNSKAELYDAGAYMLSGTGGMDWLYGDMDAEGSSFVVNSFVSNPKNYNQEILFWGVSNGYSGLSGYDATVDTTVVITPGSGYGYQGIYGWTNF